MKRIAIAGIVLASMSFCGCNKKQYTCECTTPGGPTTDFVISDTQKNAISKCSTYSTNNPGSAPTTCNIK